MGNKTDRRTFLGTSAALAAAAAVLPQLALPGRLADDEVLTADLGKVETSTAADPVLVTALFRDAGGSGRGGEAVCACRQTATAATGCASAICTHLRQDQV